MVVADVHLCIECQCRQSGLAAAKQYGPVNVASQVPNMQLYIQKWGRRVGFDLNVQPSDEALTHAIIQVLASA